MLLELPVLTWTLARTGGEHSATRRTLFALFKVGRSTLLVLAYEADRFPLIVFFGTLSQGYERLFEWTGFLGQGQQGCKKVFLDLCGLWLLWHQFGGRSCIFDNRFEAFLQHLFHPSL